MSATSFSLHRIISGGQTGVDRGALDAAIKLDLPHGGWCPRDRRAEDGPIPQRYQLQETAALDYKVRTEKNVEDADGTLILCRGPLKGGTNLTAQLAEVHNKPLLVIDLMELDDLTKLDGDALGLGVQHVHRWLADHQIETLNVAGPRESQNPGIARDACEFLTEVLAAAR